ncbi:MbtH family protein [Nesterenkonia sandarakina]|uniref:MbtH protein n=1 Tax=Nesterenkonia sandarakina TaxID=272918 RepID=A0A7Z0E7P6_9MICC|nr:MbtH family protein [Nesterenkonia sandarakina]NYJ16616.1 MbtH protein [Nesterenkonia sandarakina]
MTNPFDRDDVQFRVVINELGQHSLWPEFADVPSGWVAVFGAAARQDCLDYVEQHWADITPVFERDLAVS